MPKYAFYILSGPFGRVWCRFGYDPRKDREAVKYQTIMINLAKMGFRAMDRFRIGYKVPAANRLKVTRRGLSTGREIGRNKVGVSFCYGVVSNARMGILGWACNGAVQALDLLIWALGNLLGH